MYQACSILLTTKSLSLTGIINENTCSDFMCMYHKQYIIGPGSQTGHHAGRGGGREGGRFQKCYRVLFSRCLYSIGVNVSCAKWSNKIHF